MRDPKLQAFGQRVRELRKEQGYSQEQFADLAGLDRSYMGHIERGEKNITLLKIYQISHALNLSPKDLF
ncbi:helix-turn-helix transcriptional regulator [Ketobacter sp. MCCC 1A13808]|uniref:helix-turn-helix domain-containing protein n=1 Tax=Ketobacter sp. MCCC 1A13808 TaxID=2602738 RepID=UPI0012EC761A|nr:helix-turn-helix transcriptional regulator [Ketobacter sp. MCCC 1A13808]MVF14230.1 helix-turn-helix transcriptional regulator [Ketobacter sp. MCCC 1A13808]